MFTIRLTLMSTVRILFGADTPLYFSPFPDQVGNSMKSDSPRSNWSALASAAVSAAICCWTLGFGCSASAVSFDGHVLNYAAQTIYDTKPAPTYPDVQPYTAWVGMWQLPNGTIQCDFVQGTGPKDHPAITFPVLQSIDNGQSWRRVVGDIPTGYSRGLAVLPDGTMVRPAETYKFGPLPPNYSHILQRVSRFEGVERSTDGGRTWSPPINLVSSTDYQLAWPTVIKPLRDGRLVAFAGLIPNGVPNELGNMTKTMLVSSDKGLTWGAPITLMPATQGACEESDFVELANGNLLWIHRAEHDGISDRQQSIVRRVGDTFVPDPPTPVAFPHSGFPCELMTREGLVLDLCTTGSHWSADGGSTWQNLMLGNQAFCTNYYPKAVQAPDGTIVVVSHVGSDDEYGTVDQAIVCQTFRLSPVPEPSAGVLSGIGAAGLLTYRLLPTHRLVRHE
jgi:hypothetical protein